MSAMGDLYTLYEDLADALTDINPRDPAKFVPDVGPYVMTSRFRYSAIPRKDFKTSRELRGWKIEEILSWYTENGQDVPVWQTVRECKTTEVLLREYKAAYSGPNNLNH